MNHEPTLQRALAVALLASAVLPGGLCPAARAAGWTPAPALPPGYDFGGMVFDEGRGAPLFLGGRGEDGYARKDTFVFDGHVWQPGPAAPASMEPRSHFMMAYDSARDVTMVFGGGEGFSGYPRFNDTWELDATGWRPGAAAPPGLTPRSSGAMAFDARRGRMVLVGGVDASGVLAEVWEHAGTTWVPGVAPPPAFQAREHFAMAYDEARQRIVIFGGSLGYVPFLDDTWEYDGTTWTQGPPAAPGLAPRAGACMAFDPSRKKIVLFGGSASFDEGGTGNSGDYSHDEMNDTWFYDGTAWTPGPVAPPDLFGRAGHAMCADRVTGRVVLFGGGTFFFKGGLDDTWQLDTTGWFREAPLFPVPRFGGGMAYDDNRGVAVLFGGGLIGVHGPLNDTWETDGVTWTRGAFAPPELEPRYSGPMAFDSTRGRMVVAGGWYEPAHADTWEYDGHAWTRGPDAPFMSRRLSGAMAYDPLRGVTVHFGGYNLDGIQTTLPFPDPGEDFNYYGDTWEYDGTAWSAGPAAPAGMDPRYGAAMAFDPSRGVIVLMGGYGPHGALNDVWEYDGLQWRPGPQPTGASPRLAHTMTYDLVRGKLVFFGGQNGGGSATFSDIWELEGGTWRLGSSAPATMGARSRHLSYYDARRGRTVVLGGVDVSAQLRRDPWEYGAVHAAVLAGAGSGASSPNRVAALDEQGQPTPFDVLAYAAGTWGASADGAALDGDLVHEVVTGPGPGPVHGPQVRAFRNDGSALSKVNYFAYGTLRFGVGVAGTSLDADPFDEVVTGAGPGEVFGPHVRGWNVDGGAPSPISGASFFAYGTPRYGVVPAGGDLDGDGFGEVLTGPGPGATFAAQVRGFDVDGGVVRPMAAVSFQAFTSGYGVRPAGGDVDGDGRAEIAAAPGPGASLALAVRGFKVGVIGVTALPGFDLASGATLYGGRVELGDVVLDVRADLAVGPGPDPAAPATFEVHAYDGLTLTRVLGPVDALPLASFGVNLGSGMLGW